MKIEVGEILKSVKKFSETKTGAVVMFIVLPSTLVGAYYGFKYVQKKIKEKKIEKNK